MYNLLSTAMYVREVTMRELGFIPPALTDIMDAVEVVELSAPGPMLNASNTVRDVVNAHYRAIEDR